VHTQRDTHEGEPKRQSLTVAAVADEKKKQDPWPEQLLGQLFRGRTHLPPRQTCHGPQALVELQAVGLVVFDEAKALRWLAWACVVQVAASSAMFSCIFVKQRLLPSPSESPK
jgi:hypothetical protein